MSVLQGGRTRSSSTRTVRGVRAGSATVTATTLNRGGDLQTRRRVVRLR